MLTLSTMTANASLAAQGPSRQASDMRTTLTQSLLAQNPGLKLIEAQVRRDDARLSAIGKMALALDDFRAVAAGLAGGKLSMTATASGEAVAARLTAGSASPGVHTVDVQQLAQGQKLASKPVADKDAPIGSGAGSLITVETGSGGGAGKTTVRLEAGDSSLEGIARALRAAGLDAQVAAEGDGHALVLNGKPGAANGMRIGVAGDPALAAMFSYTAGKEGGMRQLAAAQDARVVVDGKSLTSATNTLDAALPGLSLTLKQTGKSEVGVRSEAGAVATNVKDFVSAFNALGTKLGALQSGDARNDATLRKMQGQLNGMFDGATTRELAEFGITRKNGALALDEKKLKDAAAADPERVTRLFGGAGGLAGRLTDQAARQLGDGGSLAGEAAGVMRERDKLLAQKSKVAEAVGRQASLMVQQYQLAGAGGSLLFGGGASSAGRPQSLFDYLA